MLAVQRHYHTGGRTLRAVWLVAAFGVVLAGLAMTVLPGPATLVIPVGLAMLAVRFRWAQSALRAAIDHGVRQQRRFVKAGVAARVTWSLVTLGAVGGAAFLVLR